MSTAVSAALNLPPVRRLLVVDDDQIMRDLLEAVLAIAGYEPVMAASGGEALQLLATGGAFDAVLSDLHMPGLEGAPLAASLRAALDGSTPLVGMSSTAPEPSVRRLFDAFLLKPFDAKQLAAAFQGARADALAGGSSKTSMIEASAPLASPAAADAQTPEVVLNEEVYRSLLKVIPAAQLDELYAMTLNDIERRFALIRAASAAGDRETVQREAHAIKGSCGMVGATELHKLAAKVEVATTLDAGTEVQIPAATTRLRGMLTSKQQP